MAWKGRQKPMSKLRRQAAMKVVATATSMRANMRVVASRPSGLSSRSRHSALDRSHRVRREELGDGRLPRCAFGGPNDPSVVPRRSPGVSRARQRVRSVEGHRLPGDNRIDEASQASAIPWRGAADARGGVLNGDDRGVVRPSSTRDAIIAAAAAEPIRLPRRPWGRRAARHRRGEVGVRAASDATKYLRTSWAAWQRPPWPRAVHVVGRARRRPRPPR